jgi:hypothetical protein
MLELWKTVDEFPMYKVSNLGDVVNEETGRFLNQSFNPQGAKKVGLFDGKRQHTRSVKFLVANAFVEGQNKQFDTAVNLDGDQTNNIADNLVWRPRWFAMQYARQFVEIGDWYLHRKIQDIETEVVYEDIVDAAIRHGLLHRQILLSIHNTQEVAWPTRQTFRFFD